jgi:hypothetical protein
MVRKKSVENVGKVQNQALISIAFMGTDTYASGPQSSGGIFTANLPLYLIA